jgi:glycosyltransferase involved in cell wall biosynthesis
MARLMDNSKQRHIITGEYPPQPGGVGDYTRLIARELSAAGDEVFVWGPRTSEPPVQDEGVVIYSELGRYRPADFRRADARLSEFPGPRNILMQWAPHAYGCKSLNIMICLWLWFRVKWHGDRLELMAHESYLPFKRWAWKQNLAAVVHRLMTLVIMNAASHVWISIPYWESRLRPYAMGRRLKFQWLPVISNIPVVDDSEGREAVRRRYSVLGSRIIGHFGAYDENLHGLFAQILPALLQGSHHRTILLLTGKGSDEARNKLVQIYPELSMLIATAGMLDARALSLHLTACDVMLQPYIDGVSSRRGGVMAAMAHGRAIVTTQGSLTEAIWRDSGAVELVPAGETDALVQAVQLLLDDPARIARKGATAQAFYQQHFSVERIVPILRNSQREERNHLRPENPLQPEIR